MTLLKRPCIPVTMIMWAVMANVCMAMEKDPGEYSDTSSASSDRLSVQGMRLCDENHAINPEPPARDGDAVQRLSQAEDRATETDAQLNDEVGAAMGGSADPEPPAEDDVVAMAPNVQQLAQAEEEAQLNRLLTYFPRRIQEDGAAMDGGDGETSSSSWETESSFEYDLYGWVDRHGLGGFLEPDPRSNYCSCSGWYCSCRCNTCRSCCCQKPFDECEHDDQETENDVENQTEATRRPRQKCRLDCTGPKGCGIFTALSLLFFYLILNAGLAFSLKDFAVSFLYATSESRDMTGRGHLLDNVAATMRDGTTHVVKAFARKMNAQVFRNEWQVGSHPMLRFRTSYNDDVRYELDDDAVKIVDAKYADITNTKDGVQKSDGVFTLADGTTHVVPNRYLSRYRSKGPELKLDAVKVDIPIHISDPKSPFSDGALNFVMFQGRGENGNTGILMGEKLCDKLMYGILTTCNIYSMDRLTKDGKPGSEAAVTVGSVELVAHHIPHIESGAHKATAWVIPISKRPEIVGAGHSLGAAVLGKLLHALTGVTAAGAASIRAETLAAAAKNMKNAVIAFFTPPSSMTNSVRQSPNFLYRLLGNFLRPFLEFSFRNDNYNIIDDIASWSKISDYMPTNFMVVIAKKDTVVDAKTQKTVSETLKEAIQDRGEVREVEVPTDHGFDQIMSDPDGNLAPTMYELMGFHSFGKNVAKDYMFLLKAWLKTGEVKTEGGTTFLDSIEKYSDLADDYFKQLHKWAKSDIKLYRGSIFSFTRELLDGYVIFEKECGEISQDTIVKSYFDMLRQAEKDGRYVFLGESELFGRRKAKFGNNKLVAPYRPKWFNTSGGGPGAGAAGAASAGSGADGHVESDRAEIKKYVADFVRERAFDLLTPEEKAGSIVMTEKFNPPLMPGANEEIGLN